jgi:hypothetical protein
MLIKKTQDKPNNKKNINLVNQYICKKSIFDKIKYILDGISKYWLNLDFKYYEYDIFEINTISQFYIVERRLKNIVKNRKHMLDYNEIARLFIHKDIVLIITDFE